MNIETKGKIGAAAHALGLGHKEDGELPTDLCPGAQNQELNEMPSAVHPSWDEADRNLAFALSARRAAAGDVAGANLMRRNLEAAKSPYWNAERLERLVQAIESQKAYSACELAPVEPVVYAALADVPALEDIARPNGNIPETVAKTVLSHINSQMAVLAEHGFATIETIGFRIPPNTVKDALKRLAALSGAAHRLAMQIGHLRTVSRAGGRPHAPMTFDNRTLKVDLALCQLAEICNGEKWTLATVPIVRAEDRAAWLQREHAQPNATPFPRNLFEYTWPNPATLSDGELDAKIQRHPDMGYVEQLRTEKNRRLAAITC